MKKNTYSIIILLAGMLLFRPAYSQNYAQKLIDGLLGFRRAGQSAMPFLRLGAGARTMAMGDAANTLRGDPSSLFYNPAGLAFVEKHTAMFSYMGWILDTSIRSGAVSARFGEMGCFGLSFLFFDHGASITATEIDVTQPNGYSVIGEMNPLEFFVGLGYGRRVSSHFAFGGQAKIVYQDLLGSGGVKTRTATRNTEGVWERKSKDANKTIVAFDFGTIYDTGWHGISFSMAFRNFGQEIKYERESFDLPLSFQFGFSVEAMELFSNSNSVHQIILSFDRIHPRDWSERMHFGMEYGLMDMFFVRAGYKDNYSSEGLTLGAGFKLSGSYGNIAVDYAYKETGYTLDTVHVTSLSVEF